MGYKLVHEALHTDGCKGLSKLVLVTLADYANDETGECWPSQDTIADVAGCARQTVNALIAKLIAKGYVSVYDGGHKSKSYRLSFPRHMSQIKTVVSQNMTAVSQIKTPMSQNMTGKGDIECHETRQVVSQNMTGGVTNQDTNILDNISSNKQDNIQASIATKVIESESIKSNSAADDVKVSLKELWGDAKATLSRKGLSPAEADKALKAALPGFTDKANSLKAKGFPGITNKRAYLAHMLAGMALEPSPAKPQADEPKTLTDILAHLKAEYGKAYPDYTARIGDLIDNLPPTTYETMRANESLGWPSIVSPLAWVKSRVEPLVVRGIAMAKDDEREESLKALARLRMRRAEKEWAAKCGDRRAAEDLQGLSEKIKQLEAETRAA